MLLCMRTATSLCETRRSLGPSLRASAASYSAVASVRSRNRSASAAHNASKGFIRKRPHPYPELYGRINRYGGIAQWLEQSAHNRLVPGSSPGAPTRFCMNRHFSRFFGGKFLLRTLRVLGCYFMLFLQEKWGKNCRFTPVNSSVNTLNLDYLSTSAAKSINQHSIFSYFFNTIKVFQIAIDIKSIFIIIIYKTPRTAHW